MPYWNRADALLRTLNRYNELYGEYNLEVIVVDDGSHEKPHTLIGFNWPVRLISLPSKDHARNPCLPINTGVKAASGEIVFLTNPEVFHRDAIIHKMIKALGEIGSKGYVAAACRDESKQLWLCKSDVYAIPGRAKLPENAGLHFFSCLYRSFYFEAGGFDEAYRHGRGYEDNDFLWQLHKSGAQFEILDDCVVEHMNAPRTVWPVGGTDRNRRIFERKWGP